MEGGPDVRAGRIAGLDTSVAHPARVYDHWLGGKDNFAAGREAAERVLAVAPRVSSPTTEPWDASRAHNYAPGRK